MKYFLLVMQLVPSIIAAIRSLEEFLPVEGAGKDKLAVVRQIIESTYDGAKEAWPTIEKVIATLVDLANRYGIFKTTPTK